MLENGVWVDRGHETSKGGHFKRAEATFRNWITADGSPGPTGPGGFKAEPDRYHLYISYGCPWAHRTLIYHSLKGLKNIIDISVVHWLLGEEGWTFEPSDDGLVADHLFGYDRLYKVYLKSSPHMTGRVTVPVLWDKQTDSIVSNESSEIIRMFNSAFDEVGAQQGDYYPPRYQSEIDQLNENIYHTVNNGVYKAGFAASQEAYEDAVYPLFDTLDELDQRLSGTRFLMGDQPLEADWRLLPTLLRFDMIYNCHFKCNLKRLVDFPNLFPYACDLYQWPGIADTCNFIHAKRLYYQSQKTVNPRGLIPVGPVVDFEVPHDRHFLS